MLLVGIKTSKKEAGKKHPFGYGKEQFFWSFIVATLIFSVSGVLSLEQGIASLLGHEKHKLDDVPINFIILGIASVFEGNSLRTAFKEFKRPIEERGGKLNLFTMITEFKESKNPSILTVMVEDTAALLGILIAAIALSISFVTGDTIYDAIASIIIGIMLMAFSFFLAKENKGLLIGELISTRDYKKIYTVIPKIPEVIEVVSIRSMQLAPEDVIIAIEINLIDDLDTNKIESVIDSVENKVKESIPYVNPSKLLLELEHDRKKSSYLTNTK